MNGMANRLTAAVIGTGFIGPVHVEALRRAGIQVAGIVGSSPEKSQAAAQQLQLPKGYQNLEEALADPQVDSIHITTPNRFHFEQASAALNAGKHVLCEKPLAMNSEQTAALMELARSRDLAAGVAYNIRFYPLCHHAATICQKGECGELIHVHGSYAQDWLLHRTDFNWRVLSDEGGALRAVADIGTHWLDLVQFVTGEKVTAVLADLKTVYEHRDRPVGSTETFTGKSEPSATQSIATPIDTEDCGSLLLRFANGAQGSLWVSQMTAGRKNCLRFEIAGTQKSLSWNSESPNQLEIGQRDRPNERLIRDPALMSESASRISSYPGGHNEGFPDTFKQLFSGFYDYIRQGDFSAEPPFPTFADGHHEVKLCESILKSHREQRWIQIGD